MIEVSYRTEIRRLRSHGDDKAFDKIMVEYADRYAAVTERDHKRLCAAIEDGVIDVDRTPGSEPPLMWESEHIRPLLVRKRPESANQLVTPALNQQLQYLQRLGSLVIGVCIVMGSTP